MESGEFEICVGGSSRDIVLRDTIEVTFTGVPPVRVITRNVLIGDLLRLAPTKDKAMELVADFGLSDTLRDNPDMLEAMTKDLPLRALVNFGGGRYTEQMLAHDLEELNKLLLQSGLYASEGPVIAAESEETETTQ